LIASSKLMARDGVKRWAYGISPIEENRIRFKISPPIQFLFLRLKESPQIERF
jgi:hypothetical protein